MEDTTAKRQLAISMRVLKETILSKPLKKVQILAEWLVKWASILQREDSFSPSSLKAYKQREIILVDFGFNIGGEFGSRHYAVVLEKNNNPRSNVILVAPISSYNAGEKNINPACVDLGIAAVNHKDMVTRERLTSSRCRKASRHPRHPDREKVLQDSSCGKVEAGCPPLINCPATDKVAGQSSLRIFFKKGFPKILLTQGELALHLCYEFRSRLQIRLIGMGCSPLPSLLRFFPNMGIVRVGMFAPLNQSRIDFPLAAEGP